jgi:hypothetical protein
MNKETRRGVHAASAAIGLTALSILSVAAIHTGMSLQQQSMGGLMAPLGGGATITHAPPLATMQMGKTVVENPGLVAPGAATTTTTAAGH